MAEVHFDGKSEKIKDGEMIQKSCEKMGIPFSCKDGTCGVCMIEVKEGMENLSSINNKEKDLGVSAPYRLACQCKIKKGKVSVGL